MQVVPKEQWPDACPGFAGQHRGRLAPVLVLHDEDAAGARTLLRSHLIGAPESLDGLVPVEWRQA